MESIKQELIDGGLNPDDYKITKKDGVIQVVPRWYFEMKSIAEKEDTPIKEDVNEVANMTMLTTMDKDELAEMLVYALQRIDRLEEKVNG